MEKLVEYFYEYISNYYKSETVIEKEQNAHNIMRIMSLINSIKKDKYTILITKKYKELIKQKEFENYKESFKKNFEYKENEKFSVNEFLYMKEIIKYINTNNNVSYKNTRNLSDLRKYMGDYKYLNYIKNIDIIINKKIDTCCLSLTDKNMVFLQKNDVAALIHELMHTKFIKEKFSEFPSILAELSFCSFYKIGDSGSRLHDIDILKKISLQKFNKNDRTKYFEELIYCLGSLLAVAFIYKNGNEFKNVEDATCMTHYYQNEDIFKVMNKLNITDNDIINGFKSYKKLLTK